MSFVANSFMLLRYDSVVLCKIKIQDIALAWRIFPHIVNHKKLCIFPFPFEVHFSYSIADLSVNYLQHFDVVHSSDRAPLLWGVFS